MCPAPMVPASSKSATVRATLSTRWKARAESAIWRVAAASRAAASRSSRACAVLAHRRRPHLRVEARVRVREALPLDGAHGPHARGDGGRGLARRGFRQLLVVHTRHVEEDVDAVEHGAGDAALVARRRVGGADALARGVAAVAAGAGVLGGHEGEAGGEGGGRARAADGDRAVLQRLAQHLQHLRAEFGQLVEEEDAVVAERDLARARVGAAAHQPRVGDGVVGRAEGALAQQARAGRQQPGHAVDARHLQRLVVRHGRQDGGDGARQQRLAAARRPAHEHVVPARGGHGQPPLHVLLPDHLAQVGAALGRLRGGRGFGGPGRDGILAQQVHGQLREGVHGVDLDAVHERGLGRVGRGHEGAARAPVPRHGDHGQGSADGAHLAVERQLAHEHGIVERGLHLPAGHEDARGDGQVVGGALLAQVGGGEVHGDAAVEGPGEGAVADGRAHALAGLLHGGVGQAHDRRRRILRARDVDLDVDHHAVEPGNRARPHPGEHGRSVAHGVPRGQIAFRAGRLPALSGARGGGRRRAGSSRR